MNLSIYEQLEEASSARFRKKKIEILRSHRSSALVEILDLTFNPKIKFLLPEEIKYKPSDDNEKALVGRLKQEGKNLRNRFTNVGKYPTMLPNKRLNLFVQTIEGIHPKDAELMLQIKDKKLPFSNLTPDIISEAFPELGERWK